MKTSAAEIRNSHVSAVLLALLVTFLWSTSWVLIKAGLRQNLPPLTFAGLRYSLAFLCLAPFVLLNGVHRKSIVNFSRDDWSRLILLGFVFYTLTQGAQFLSLVFLPAATLTLILNFSPVFVAVSSNIINKEKPQFTQWIGILLSVTGAVIYFYPLVLPAEQSLGFIVASVAVLSNSGASLLGRKINYQTGLSPVVVTTISMGFGGILLLLTGIVTQGFGDINFVQWLIIAWLAVINTAVAFTLWNKTLQTLTAVESSVINNLMLPQIALLAWIFLGESLTAGEITGLILVGIGALTVQLWRQLPAVFRNFIPKN